jgi:hypothetical protein
MTRVFTQPDLSVQLDGLGDDQGVVEAVDEVAIQKFIKVMVS